MEVERLHTLYVHSELYFKWFNSVRIRNTLNSRNWNIYLDLQRVVTCFLWFPRIINKSHFRLTATLFMRCLSKVKARNIRINYLKRWRKEEEKKRRKQRHTRRCQRNGSFIRMCMRCRAIRPKRRNKESFFLLLPSFKSCLSLLYSGSDFHNICLAFFAEWLRWM